MIRRYWRRQKKYGYTTEFIDVQIDSKLFSWLADFWYLIIRGYWEVIR